MSRPSASNKVDEADKEKREKNYEEGTRESQASGGGEKKHGPFEGESHFSTAWGFSLRWLSAIIWNGEVSARKGVVFNLPDDACYNNNHSVLQLHLPAMARVLPTSRREQPWSGTISLTILFSEGIQCSFDDNRERRQPFLASITNPFFQSAIKRKYWKSGGMNETREKFIAAKFARLILNNILLCIHPGRKGTGESLSALSF